MTESEHPRAVRRAQDYGESFDAAVRECQQTGTLCHDRATFAVAARGANVQLAGVAATAHQALLPGSSRR